VTIQVDLIPAVTNVLKQQEAPDLLKEPEVNVLPPFQTEKDIPKNPKDLAI
jgi:hypothetical protein